MAERWIGKKNTSVKITFSRLEVQMLEQLLNYVLSQITIPSVKKRLGLSRMRYERFNNLVKSASKELDKKHKDNIDLLIDKSEYENLLLAFQSAMDYAEEWEFPIATGYSWNDALRMRERLEHALSI